MNLQVQTVLTGTFQIDPMRSLVPLFEMLCNPDTVPALRASQIAFLKDHLRPVILSSLGSNIELQRSLITHIGSWLANSTIPLPTRDDVEFFIALARAVKLYHVEGVNLIMRSIVQNATYRIRAAAEPSAMAATVDHFGSVWAKLGPSGMKTAEAGDLFLSLFFKDLLPVASTTIAAESWNKLLRTYTNAARVASDASAKIAFPLGYDLLKATAAAPGANLKTVKQCLVLECVLVAFVALARKCVPLQKSVSVVC